MRWTRQRKILWQNRTAPFTPDFTGVMGSGAAM